MVPLKAICHFSVDSLNLNLSFFLLFFTHLELSQSSNDDLQENKHVWSGSTLFAIMGSVQGLSQKTHELS